MVGESTQLVNGGVDLSKKPVWIEGPHIFKKDGWYYLTAAEGGHQRQPFAGRVALERASRPLYALCEQSDPDPARP